MKWLLIGCVFGLVIAFSLNKVFSSELKSLYIEAEKAIKANRHYELENVYDRQGSLNLGMNLKLGDIGYFHNRIESTYGSTQFDQIAWRTELGFNADTNVDIYYSHYSSHALDGDNFRTKLDSELKYPQLNSIGLRWRIK